MKKLACLLVGLSVSAGAASAVVAQTSKVLSRPQALAIINAKKADLFRDPGSIRDAEATNTRASDGGTMICIKVNAKNELGGYGGRKSYLVWIDAGKPYIVEAVDPNKQCGSFSAAPGLNARNR
jgi:hypothetical protein